MIMPLKQETADVCSDSSVRPDTKKWRVGKYTGVLLLISILFHNAISSTYIM
jgi:hypothetical protein